MKRPTYSVVFYLSLVFLSGLLVGAIGTLLYNARSVDADTRARFSPEQMRQRYIEEMRTRLKLRPDQLSKVVSILDSTRESYRELREKYRPEVKALQDSQVNQIRSVLDESQQQEYEKMRAERERQHQQHQQGKKGGTC